jgi:hypothetical protein
MRNRNCTAVCVCGVHMLVFYIKHLLNAQNVHFKATVRVTYSLKIYLKLNCKKQNRQQINEEIN